MKNKVPDGLSRCIRGDHDDAEVEDEINTFEAHALVLTQARAANRENEEEEEITEEEVEIFDVWDKLSDQDRVANLEDTPVPINITEILDALRTDGFGKEIRSKQDRSASRLVEPEDGLLRRVSADDEKNLQIVMPEVICPRLLNLTHHYNSAGYPGKKRMYSRLKKRFYFPHMAADIATTIKRRETCAKNRLKIEKTNKPNEVVPRPRASNLFRRRHPGTTPQVE